MKLNTDKCCLIVYGTNHEHAWVKLGKDKIWENNYVKRLGVKIDNKLKFNEYILSIIYA